MTDRIPTTDPASTDGGHFADDESRCCVCRADYDLVCGECRAPDRACCAPHNFLCRDCVSDLITDRLKLEQRGHPWM